jgi:micrococcal nuclease
MTGRRAHSFWQAKAAALGIGAAFFLAAGVAHADPCRAPLPRPGTRIEGPVRYVGDGDSLCIGSTADPGTWIEIRLADFYAPELHDQGGREARQALVRITQGRRIDCIADHRSYDRIVAACRLDGIALGELLRRAGVAQGGRGRDPQPSGKRVNGD